MAGASLCWSQRSRKTSLLSVPLECCEDRNTQEAPNGGHVLILLHSTHQQALRHGYTSMAEGEKAMFSQYSYQHRVGDAEHPCPRSSLIG